MDRVGRAPSPPRTPPRPGAAIDALAAPVPARRCVLGHRGRPGQGVDRPGRRPRHHRHRHHHHRPSHRSPSHLRAHGASPDRAARRHRRRRPLGRWRRRRHGRRRPPRDSRCRCRCHGARREPRGQACRGRDRCGRPGRGHRPRRRGTGPGLPPVARPTTIHHAASAVQVATWSPGHRGPARRHGHGHGSGDQRRGGRCRPGRGRCGGCRCGGVRRPTGTGPRKRLARNGSAPGTGAAGSPAATSPPCSATSTTSGPGRHGNTRHDNLLCLCRRHHRSQHNGPGWQVTLAPDGVATWTATPPGVSGPPTRSTALRATGLL